MMPELNQTIPEIQYQELGTDLPEQVVHYEEEEKEDKESKYYDDYLPKIDGLMNSTMISPLAEVTGILELLLNTVPMRNPSTAFQYVTDLQVKTNPQKTAAMFKYIGNQTGSQELKDFADLYKDCYLTGPILLYGLGLVQKAGGSLEGILKPTKGHQEALKLKYPGMELNDAQSEYLTSTAMLGYKYRDILPFNNSESFDINTLMMIASGSSRHKPFLPIYNLTTTDYANMGKQISGGDKLQRDLMAQPYVAGETMRRIQAP